MVGGGGGCGSWMKGQGPTNARWTPDTEDSMSMSSGGPKATGWSSSREEISYAIYAEANIIRDITVLLTQGLTVPVAQGPPMA